MKEKEETNERQGEGTQPMHPTTTSLTTICPSTSRLTPSRSNPYHACNLLPSKTNLSVKVAVQVPALRIEWPLKVPVPAYRETRLPY